MRSVTPTSPPGFEREHVAVPETPNLGSGALFMASQPALLPEPEPEFSPRPSPPACRRKTLAAGFTVSRSSLRIKDKHRGAPIAKLAERNLLRKLGIVDEGDVVTQEAIDSFISMFKTELPPYAIAALRAMFKLDCARAEAVEEALIRLGGPGAMDHDIQEDVVQA